ncbi:MAG: cation transporter [Actinomycetaceae bacterium]|nr:cation transporter [Actinomycetaceae bacterium]
MNVTKRLGIAFGLIFSIVVVQLVGVLLTGSLALAVDIVHSLADSVGLLVALITAILMNRPPAKNRTWGLRRLEVVSALFQSLALAGISIFAFVSAISRWQHPHDIAGEHLIIVGILSLILNVSAAVVLMGERDANFNIRAAFLEVVMDALGTLAVVVSGIVMAATGYARMDTIAAVVIALMIFPRAVKLAKETLAVLLEFVPEGLDLDEVRAYILEQPHVVDVHDLHASTIGTGLVQLSAHVVVEDRCFRDGCAPETLTVLQQAMRNKFPVQIEHATFQLEATSQEAECHVRN